MLEGLRSEKGVILMLYAFPWGDALCACAGCAFCSFAWKSFALLKKMKKKCKSR